MRLEEHGGQFDWWESRTPLTQCGSAIREAAKTDFASLFATGLDEEPTIDPSLQFWGAGQASVALNAALP
jgi:hypothetical protein